MYLPNIILSNFLKNKYAWFVFWFNHVVLSVDDMTIINVRQSHDHYF